MGRRPSGGGRSRANRRGVGSELVRQGRTHLRSARSALSTPGRDHLSRAGKAATVSGIAIFVAGILGFVAAQTQHIFRQAGEAIDNGRIPRNDGGILFTAIVAGFGFALLVASLSRRPLRERVAPTLGLLATVGLILVLHFSIFVNGILVPSENAALVTASFLFHDAASFPISTFVLALATGLLMLLCAQCVMSLITPRILATRFRRPQSLDGQRTRVLLTGLATLLVSSAFGLQFFRYAAAVDATPSGGFSATSMTLVYYILALAIGAALVVGIWRVNNSLWGDLREKRSRTFRRTHAYLTNAETWLWGFVLALNAVVLFTKPVVVPDRHVDPVFLLNSKGVSIFFLLVLAFYIPHRRAERALLDHVRQQPSQLHVAHVDHLARMAIAVTVSWILVGLLMESSQFTQLVQLLVQTSVATFVLLFSAVRIDLRTFGLPSLRGEGAPQVLLASAILSILTGIMLWGVGNSVTTIYIPSSGGFVTPEESILQPYATGINLLGSLFIAVPIVGVLWFLAARSKMRVHPGPLFIAGLALVFAMNSLLTISAGDQYDAAVRQTDVLIGFNIIGFDAFNRAVILIAWSAAAIVGAVSAAVLIDRGADRLRHEWRGPEGGGRPSTAT